MIENVDDTNAGCDELTPGTTTEGTAVMSESR
jgi:hypothetical protein